MLTRLTHAAIAFALTVVVYQSYVIFAVPFIEPGAQNKEAQQQLELDQLRVERKATHKHRDLLSAYFPAGHWTLQDPPKTFETERMMVVLDDYHPGNDGKVRVQKCVLIFFPRPRVQGAPAPRDAVVLEAPHGAVLQMDTPGLPGLSGMGRIQQGKLIGDIVVRSDMREPGPEDDLLITTRDVTLNEDMIRTDDKVEMQLGPHWGRGRVMEIRLVAVERAPVSSGGPQLGGIDSLEILYDVRAQLTPNKMSFFPNNAQAPSGKAPPVKIASRGRFRFDFPNYMASFTDQVQVVQEYSAEVRDQLFCHELNLFFSGEQPRIKPADMHHSGESKGSSNLSKLRPGSIEALGSDKSPVVLQAPSQQAAARCDRMRLEIDSRRVTFDSKDEVILSYDGNEIYAPMVRYQAPPKDSPERIGTLMAAGNGRILAMTGKEKSEPLEVRWTQEMRLQRINGKPVLSLRGRPKFDMLGLGTLWANHLKVTLRERKIDGSEDSLLPGDVVPEHIVATGLVGIESPQLAGKVNSLDVHVQYKESGLQLGTADGRDSRGQPMLASNRQQAQSRAYHVVGDELKVYLTVRERRPEVSYIGVQGNVVFRETAQNNATTEPLLVQAQTLSVKNADTQDAEIDLVGKPATISAAGMSIQAEKLRLNRGSSNVWIDSPGQLNMHLDKDFRGNPLPSPQPFSIAWHENMELIDGKITFRGKVRAQSLDGVLDTERMVALLAGPVKFDGAATQQRTQIAQIECWEGVHAQFQERDQFGLTSTQVMQLESIRVNQQTGKIEGDGPGEIESVHLTKGGSPMKRIAAANSPSANSNFGGMGQKLGYLNVQFRQGVQGNLHQRRVEVVGDARAVYGPVDSWEQKLAISLSGTPGPDTIWITSDRIGVNQSPTARAQRLPAMDAIELLASGDVTIEGPAGERGTFTARAEYAKYDQHKTMFVLEGDGTRPASLIHQEFVGAPFSEQAARKLTYIQKTGEVKLEGVVKGEWNHIDLRKPPARPGQPAIR